MSDLPLSDPSSPLDPADPSRRPTQPARLAALVAAVRERTAARARRSGSSWAPASAAWPTTSRTRSRSRSPTCPAGRPRPRPGTPVGCCSGTLGGTAGRDAPGPLPPLRGQPPGPRRPAGAAVPCRSGRRIVVLTNAAGGLDPSFGPGTLMVMSRPHQPDRARTRSSGPTPTSSGRASPTSPTPGARGSARVCTRPARPRASTWPRASTSG